MMSATGGWCASSVGIVVLAIASITGGCMCSGTCDSETRLTASVYPTINEDGKCTSGAVNPDEIGAGYIVALITDKMQLASVNLPRLLRSSQTPVNFDFMRFFNWSDKDIFVTRSNIVIAPVKPGIDASKTYKSKKGVILYPDRDPNGMLHIQLVLIKKEVNTKNLMNGLVSKNALNGTPIDGRSRLWPLWNDLSAQADFTAAILSNVESEDIVSWDTFSFFEDEEDYYGFSNEKPEQLLRLPINGSSKNGCPFFYLEVSAWNHAPS